MSPESKIAHDRLDNRVYRYTMDHILKNNTQGIPTPITSITRYFSCNGYSVDLIYDSLDRLSARGQLMLARTGRTINLSLPPKGAH